MVNYQHLVILLQEVLEMILLSVREDLVRGGDESMTITLRGDLIIIHHTVDVAEDEVGDGIILTIEDVHDLIRDILMIIGGDIVVVAMVEMVMIITGMVVHNNIIIVPRKVKVVVVV